MSALTASSLGSFIKDVETLSTFVELMVNGHRVPSMRRVAIEALAKIDDLNAQPTRTEADVRDDEKRLAQIRELEEFADRENTLGFPYLHGIAIVRMWSILSAAIDHVVLMVLKDPAQLREISLLEKIKAPISLILSCSDDEKAEFLREALRRELAIDLKLGVGKFEDLLNALGLGGDVPAVVRRNILHLCETRNVIVHRNGIIDRRFLAKCPWTTLTVGDRAPANHQYFATCFTTSLWYIFEIQRRLIERGIDKGEAAQLKTHIDDSLPDLLGALEKIPL